MTAPTLTLGVSNFGTAPEAGWRELLEVARVADATGIDRITLSDHVVMGPRTDAYAWGPFPVPPDADWLEPLTALTAMAAVTTRVRLSTSILIAPLRPAALLAKTVATLDVLSEGRVDLGVGTGWQREEFLATGVAFEQRGRILTDAVGACRALWTGAPVTFTSPTVTFAETSCIPAPRQRPLPVWFSGVLHERNIARIVELGDGWIPIMGADDHEIGTGIQVLSDRLTDAGRDPDRLTVTAPPAYRRAERGGLDLEGTLASVPRLVELGVTDVRVELQPLLRRGALPEVLGELREAFDAVLGTLR